MPSHFKFLIFVNSRDVVLNISLMHELKIFIFQRAENNEIFLYIKKSVCPAMKQLKPILLIFMSGMASNVVEVQTHKFFGFLACALL